MITSLPDHILVHHYLHLGPESHFHLGIGMTSSSFSHCNLDEFEIFTAGNYSENIQKIKNEKPQAAERFSQLGRQRLMLGR